MGRGEDALEKARRTALERGVRFHPNWRASQVWAAINFANPAYTTALKVGRDRAWQRMRQGEGYIYLAAVVSRYPLVKMGYALDIDNRMRTLGTDYRGLQFKLLRATPGNFRRERWLHSVLKPHRIERKCAREFYLADYLYDSGVDLPQGFMVALSTFLNENPEAVAA